MLGCEEALLIVQVQKRNPNVDNVNDFAKPNLQISYAASITCIVWDRFTSPFTVRKNTSVTLIIYTHVPTPSPLHQQTRFSPITEIVTDFVPADKVPTVQDVELIRFSQC
jgi:hypothetical protein